MKSAQHLRLAAVMVGCLFGVPHEGRAQAPSSSPASSAPTGQAPRPYAPPLGMVFRRVPGTLPPVPHEARPNLWPQPDYVAEAVPFTRLRPSERVQSLSLRWPADSPRPSHVVLPVQTQAFGFTAAFRALVAARLDHELAARGIAASRQTHIVDASGPFVRRFSDDAVTALAREHAAAALVGLYLGHDGADKAFLTLVLRSPQDRPGTPRQAHRTIDLPATARPAVESIADVVPILLDELGLKGTEEPRSGDVPAPGCTMKAWQLEDLDVRAPQALRACHALAVGSLMPAFEANAHFASGDTPSKLAWLATAWTEARSLARAQGSYNAIADLAWEQLRLDDRRGTAAAHEAIDDAVARPVAQLLSARDRGWSRPVASARAATQAFLETASKPLPPLARMAFIERGNQEEDFREVDLCAIEREVPGVMVRAQCRLPQPAPRAEARPTDTARAIYQEWRLAYYDKSLRYLGTTTGLREGLARFVSTMPEDVAEHPLIRRTRFVVEQGMPAQGSFDQQLERARALTQGFVQSTFDAQRHGDALVHHSLSGHAWGGNRHIWDDPKVAELVDAERRLLAVLRLDRFDSWYLPTLRYQAGQLALFLAPGSMIEAVRQARPAGLAPAATASPAMSANGHQSLAQRSPFYKFPHGQVQASVESLRDQIARHPTDMRARIDLAMLLLKQGKPVAQAHIIIDGQPANHRIDERVEQSHTWAIPAHAFYFAGDTDSARRYYRRVREIGTGSDSDMIARVRLRLLEDNFEEAVQATQARVQRYGSDFARRDRAAQHFMSRQPDRAWDLLLPRLPNASSFQLWQGAFVGHRMAGEDMKSVAAWIDRKKLDRAQVDQRDMPALYLHLHATTDRVPSEPDIAALRATSSAGYANVRWAASATLQRMALLDDFPSAAFDAVRNSLPLDATPGSNFMRPLYTWAAWHATRGNDPELAQVRATALDDDDFDLLLAKSMLLGLERQHAESLAYLRAARWQMSELGLGHENVERPIPSPYQYALSAYLLWRKTGHEPYRAEALGFARAYQRVFPFWGWNYALEALLDDSPAARAKAICRARHLDPSSYFLSRVPGANSGHKVACGPILW